MGRACGAYRGEERCAQSPSGETWVGLLEVLVLDVNLPELEADKHICPQIIT